MLAKKIRLISSTIALTLIGNSVGLALATSEAACAPAVSLKVGDTVKDCDRVGVRTDVMESINRDLAEGDANKRIVKEQGELIALKDLSIKMLDTEKSLYKADAIEARIDADKNRKRSEQNLVIGFVVGLLTVVATGWALGQVSN